MSGDKTPSITLSGEQFEKLLSMIGHAPASNVQPGQEELARIAARHKASDDLPGRVSRQYRVEIEQSTEAFPGSWKTTGVLVCEESRPGEEWIHPQTGEHWTGKRVTRLEQIDTGECAALARAHIMPMVQPTIDAARRAGDVKSEQEILTRVESPGGLGHGQVGVKHLVWSCAMQPALRAVIGKNFDRLPTGVRVLEEIGEPVTAQKYAGGAFA